ncbi:MAG: ABC transporter substrate-binding protein, partial [Pseudomonadota bacterium]
MRQLYIVFITLLVISLLSVAARPGYAEKVRGVSDDIIRIGVIVDQTGPGCSVTVPMTEATRVYFKHINDQGGVNGRKVEIIVEDDRYTIPGAFAAFKKLIFKDEVLSILFCGGTGQVLALMRQIEMHNVPVIPLSMAETMTTPLRRYIFTPAASYDDGLKIIIDYIMKDLEAKDPKISLVYPDIEFGKTGLRTIEDYLKKYNLRLTSKEVLAVTAIDATSQVLRLNRTKPDYIILNNAVSAVISFLRGAKKYGLRRKVIGSFYVSEEDLIRNTGDASK